MFISHVLLCVMATVPNASRSSPQGRPQTVPHIIELRKELDALPTGEQLLRTICSEQLKTSREVLLSIQNVIRTIESKEPTERTAEYLKFYRDFEARVTRDIAELERGRLPVP
jgi:hypothetical protein